MVIPGEVVVISYRNRPRHTQQKPLKLMCNLMLWENWCSLYQVQYDLPMETTGSSLYATCTPCTRIGRLSNAQE